jgi:hypothetical protein
MAPPEFPERDLQWSVQKGKRAGCFNLMKLNAKTAKTAKASANPV